MKQTLGPASLLLGRLQGIQDDGFMPLVVMS